MLENNFNSFGFNYGNTIAAGSTNSGTGLLNIFTCRDVIKITGVGMNISANDAVDNTYINAKTSLVFSSGSNRLSKTPAGSTILSSQTYTYYVSETYYNPVYWELFPGDSLFINSIVRLPSVAINNVNFTVAFYFNYIMYQ